MYIDTRDVTRTKNNNIPQQLQKLEDGEDRESEPQPQHSSDIAHKLASLKIHVQ